MKDVPEYKESKAESDKDFNLKDSLKKLKAFSK